MLFCVLFDVFVVFYTLFLLCILVVVGMYLCCMMCRTGVHFNQSKYFQTLKESGFGCGKQACG